MAKNPNGKSTPAKRSESLNGAMIFFLIGCVAEAYLFMIRRFVVNGTIEEVLAWYDYLKYFAWFGVGLLIAGVAVGIFCKKNEKKPAVGWSVAGIGAFLMISGFLIRIFVGAAVTLLSVVVPVAMILVLLWSFYERECAVSLTVLSVSLVVLWVCRRKLGDVIVGNYVMVGAVIYLVLLAAVAWLAKKGKLSPLMPANADLLPVYAACGLSAIGIVSAFISATIAYYVMLGLAVVVFALAVYYTVKML